MRQQTTRISPEDISRQLQYCREVAALSAARPAQPLAFVDTYGCQQNEADSERIRGYLREMGYGFTQDEEQAQIIVLNTCAIREHAEQRVLGNVGALVHVKRRHPEQIICVCGCMAQEAHVAEQDHASPIRHVDLVFGPHALWQLPRAAPHRCSPSGGGCSRSPDEARLHRRGHPRGAAGQGEGLGVHHVRLQQLLLLLHRALCPGPGALPAGRRTSWRRCEQLVAEGYKDITLLGQNVNSYGKDLEEPMDFADLLERVERRARGLPDPLYDQPPQGRHPEAL